jgi:hypothetical protein
MTRISGIGIVVLAISLVLQARPAAAEPHSLQVYKSLTCGCCQKWVDYLRSRGYQVTISNVVDVNRAKRELGVPSNVSSCHTAFVEGYFIEGHVPADDISRLLAERPNIAGLALPGMPPGSPGMESPNAQTYFVLAIDKNGKASVFAEHHP